MMPVGRCTAIGHFKLSEWFSSFDGDERQYIELAFAARA
jgi:hypothetical protein